MIPKLTICASLAIALSATLTGCKFHRAYGNFDDGMWLNNQWRYVACRTHETLPVYGVLAAGGMSWTTTKKEWTLVTLPPPGQMTFRPKEREFLKIKGDDGLRFLLVKGSDFLIRQIDGQCTLFDPLVGKTVSGKDVSKPLPAPYLFNRSRTACLVVTNEKTAILDTLSALVGEPRILAEPPWGAALKRLDRAHQSAFLTDDARHLVLLLGPTTPDEIKTSHFTIEVISTNGDRERHSILLTDPIRDVECVDGKILLLTRGPLPDSGTQDIVKLIDLQGETLHLHKVEWSSQTAWNPPANLLLFTP